MGPLVEGTLKYTFYRGFWSFPNASFWVSLRLEGGDVVSKRRLFSELGPIVTPLGAQVEAYEASDGQTQ